GGDGVAAHPAGGRGRGGQRQAADHGRRVAVDQADVAGRQGGVGPAVDLCPVGRRDGQRGRGDGEGAGHVADAVVGRRRARGRDRIAADAAGGRGGGGQRQAADHGGRVAVDQAAVGGGQGRVGAAVHLVHAVGRDGQVRRV